MKKLLAILGCLAIAATVYGAELRLIGKDDIWWGPGPRTYPSGKTIDPVTIDNAAIDNGSVTSEKIAAGAVTSDKIAAGAAIANISDNSVGPAKLTTTTPRVGGQFYRSDGAWAVVDNVTGYATLPIDGSQILDGTLTLNLFPADTRPIRVLGALPTCGSVSYPTGAVVFLNTDYKLYLCKADATWGALVRSSDIDGVIVDNALKEGAISSALAFASTIRPVVIVGALPSLPSTSYPIGALVVLTTDGALYKNIANVWTAAVPQVDNVILNNQLTAAAIAAANPFAATIRPVYIVGSLPALPDSTYPAGAVVVLTTDGKLYRNVGGAWTAEVPAVDITGTVTNAQIDTVDASKITGTIVATTVADDSITTPKLAANAVTAAKIAAGTITSNELASNSIVAGKIAAGAVSATELAANSVTADKILALAVDAGKLAANSVVAGKIAAGAINSSAILASSVVADTALIGGISAGKLAADHLSATNTASGTFQQGYAAPSGSAPGTGMRITGGNIEAYGGTHTFGGTVVNTDGNYLVSIGKYLTATGLLTHYPQNNSTYFTEDGQLHVYRWSGSAWVQSANIGQSTAGGDPYVVYANMGTSTRGRGVYGTTAAGDGVGVQGVATGSSGYGLMGTGSGTGTYGIYASTTSDSAGAPVVIKPSSTSGPPTHAAQIGSLWLGNEGTLYQAVSGGGGYASWKTVGVSSTNLTGISLATGSQCTFYDGVTFTYHYYVKSAGPWMLVYSVTP